jgi:hypothetical protein
MKNRLPAGEHKRLADSRKAMSRPKLSNPAPKNERNQEQYKKDHEEYLRNPSRSACDSGKTQKRCDQRDHQEYD